MTSKYRDFSYSPREFPHATQTEPLATEHFFLREEVFSFIAHDFDTMGRTTYLNWVAQWKRLYLYVSLDIKQLKELGHYGYVKKYQKVANTLLNARVFAKDQRRKVTNHIA